MTAASLDGKVALVTGAATGIGRAAAQAFAAAGARVTIADVNSSELQETARLLEAAGARVLPVDCDVADEDSVQSMIARTVERYGRLDCALNNAGIDIPHEPLAEISARDWSRVLAINLTGVFQCMKYELLQMLANDRGQGGGAIVNISSAAGLMGVTGGAPYVAAKHGVVGITKTAALDYARLGIRVNALCPGLVRTALIEQTLDAESIRMISESIPRGSIGEAHEIAAAAVWLCSDQASYINGAAIPIDGAALAGR